MIKIFMSASVPLPDRNPKYMQTADVIAIRDAVKALVEEVLPHGDIVFGGHPAITPLIAFLLRGMGDRAVGRVILYQSYYFAKNFPEENNEFLDIKLLPEVEDSREKSLALMRKHMIGDTVFDAAVFIGGMEGIIEEHTLFSQAHPEAQCWPLASTGAAALELFDLLGKPNPPLFLEEMTYNTLFRNLIKQLPCNRKDDNQ